ncbi:MAG: DUF433 domain-containing protein [Candidatus Bipolaricaulota bacterium]|nr:DUF433 domain-containing protein [Candidatus Bipolaricaulota bacterium]MBS3791517.1 DUF433 domain-containing protein [Candidatus Bipolaricaulota bacterium]
MNYSDQYSCSGDRHSVTAFIEGDEANDGIEKIKGTDIPVWKIVKLHLEGFAIEDIIERFSDLSEKQVRGAVSYYYCHRRRITRRIEESEEVD